MGVRVNEAPMLQQVLARLPPGWTPSRSVVADELFSVYCASNAGSPRVRRFDLLYRGGSRLVRTLDREELLENLEGHVKLCVAEMATRWVFLHAGVVGWKGGAILIPGRSHSGKSRLVQALVRRGATYYSDDYAVLDAQGRVHPYLAPLSVRDESGRKQRSLPESPGGTRVLPALPVSRVVLTRYSATAAWKPRRLSPGRGVLALLDHAIPARRRPGDVIAVLRRVVSGAPAYKSARGEADAVAALLLDA